MWLPGAAQEAANILNRNSHDCRLSWATTVDSMGHAKATYRPSDWTCHDLPAFQMLMRARQEPSPASLEAYAF